MKTRLISIVSKPIKVVVVVIVVVSVKKNSPNNFWSKNKSCPKNFRPKSVGSKKIWVEKKLGPKKFWSKKLRFYKFRSKKTLCPKEFQVGKIQSNWDNPPTSGQVSVELYKYCWQTLGGLGFVCEKIGISLGWNLPNYIGSVQVLYKQVFLNSGPPP